jgi:hypothetical protein
LAKGTNLGWKQWFDEEDESDDDDYELKCNESIRNHQELIKVKITLGKVLH